MENNKNKQEMIKRVELTHTKGENSSYNRSVRVFSMGNIGFTHLKQLSIGEVKEMTEMLKNG